MRFHERGKKWLAETRARHQAQRFRGRFNRNPVHAAYPKFVLRERAARRDADRARGGFERRDKERFARGDSESLALADRARRGAGMRSQNFSRERVADGTRLTRGRTALPQQRTVVAPRQKTKVAAPAFLAHGQARFFRDGADLRFGQVADGEAREGELRLREAVQEIRLILGGVACAEE